MNDICLLLHHVSNEGDLQFRRSRRAHVNKSTVQEYFRTPQFRFLLTFLQSNHHIATTCCTELRSLFQGLFCDSSLQTVRVPIRRP